MTPEQKLNKLIQDRILAIKEKMYKDIDKVLQDAEKEVLELLGEKV